MVKGPNQFKMLIHNKMCIQLKRKRITLLTMLWPWLTLLTMLWPWLTLLTMLWPWLTLLTMLWPWLTLLTMLCLWDLGHSHQNWWISKASINFVRSKLFFYSPWVYLCLVDLTKFILDWMKTCLKAQLYFIFLTSLWPWTLVNDTWNWNDRI